MRHLAGLLAGGLWCCAVLADAPLVSETADTLKAGRCQVELALARQRSPAQGAVHANDTLLSCGITPLSQAMLGYGRERADGSTTQALGLVGKTHLGPAADSSGWALRYGVQATQTPGERWRVQTLEVLAVFTGELAPGLLGHANLGHSHARLPRQRSTTWALGLETTGTWVWAGDVYGDDRGRPWLSTGLGYSVGAGFSVNTSVAMHFERPRVHLLTLGAKVEF